MQRAGLLAVSQGFYAMYDDDLKYLDMAKMLCDAFYHWTRESSGDGAALSTELDAGFS